ncbi:hypothetical protein QUF76_04350 [Desulfobacterales bacterium HSG16]|nr:hypothetical protein [Desulfobacterales bacterium HSG16]
MKGDKTVNINDLKQVSIFFPGDLYELASWIIKANAGISKIKSGKSPGSITVSTTVNGLVKNYAWLTDISIEDIKQKLKENNIYLGAILQEDGVTSPPFFGRGLPPSLPLRKG